MMMFRSNGVLQEVGAVCIIGARDVPNFIGGIETVCVQLYPQLKGIAPEYSYTLFTRAYLYVLKLCICMLLVLTSLRHGSGKWINHPGYHFT